MQLWSRVSRVARHSMHMDASVDYCFTYLILILCKYLYHCIYGNTKQAIFNRWISLNMYKCIYNPGVASTHCVQQLCEISV